MIYDLFLFSLSLVLIKFLKNSKKNPRHMMIGLERGKIRFFF